MCCAALSENVLCETGCAASHGPPLPSTADTHSQTCIFICLHTQIGISSFLPENTYRNIRMSVEKKKSDYLPYSVPVNFPGLLGSKENGEEDMQKTLL